MKVINAKDIEEKIIEGDTPLFTGGKIYTQFMLDEEFGAKKIQIVNVKFAAGARNKFHTHTTEQILFATDGQGIVATRDQEYIMTPGTVAFISPGEEHWHGATKDSSFAHLSIISQPSELNIVEE